MEEESKMLRKFIALLTAAVLVISGIGCATTNPDGTPNTAASTAGGAAGGALLGAGLGALIGLATGDVARGAALGAIVGAAAGGLGGFAYAKTEQKAVRDRQAAEAMYKYNAQQGERVILEGVEVSPLTTTQGEKISMNADFTVLNGSDQTMAVEVTRTIAFQGKQMGQPYRETTIFPSGSYSYATPTQIPAEAPEGKYTVVTLVQTPNAKDERMCEFLVTKKAASNEREIHLVSVNGVSVNN
jgi:hypothetical protein